MIICAEKYFGKSLKDSLSEIYLPFRLPRMEKWYLQINWLYNSNCWYRNSWNICGVTDPGQTLFLSRLSIACVTRDQFTWTSQWHSGQAIHNTLCVFQSILKHLRGSMSQALAKPLVNFSIKFLNFFYLLFFFYRFHSFLVVFALVCGFSRVMSGTVCHLQSWSKILRRPPPPQQCWVKTCKTFKKRTFYASFQHCIGGRGDETNVFIYHFGHFHSFITLKLC